MNINFEYYKTFYYVAKYGSISKAADVLMYNQPNITRSIKKLENELGCTLFVRSNRGVTLTPEGEKLFSHVSSAVSHITSAEDELAAQKGLEHGTVTIGATEVALHCFLLPVLRKFKQKYPGIRIQVSNHSTPQAVAALKAGAVDIAVVTSPVGKTGSLTVKELAEFTEVPVGGEAYRELSEKPMTLAELADYTLIGLSKNTKTYEFYADLFSAHGVDYLPDTEAATADQILPFVRNDLGIGFVPAEFLEDISDEDIYRIIITDAQIKRRVYLLKNPDNPMSISAKELEKVIIKNAKINQ